LKPVIVDRGKALGAASPSLPSIILQLLRRISPDPGEAIGLQLEAYDTIRPPLL
jgi:hypothetical protein